MDPETGEVLERFRSMYDAAKSIKRPTGTAQIRSAIMRGGLCSGFKWAYADPGVTHSDTHSAPRKVAQWTIDGYLAGVYDSLGEASLYTGVHVSRICRCCKRQGEGWTGAGYRWTYWPDRPIGKVSPHGGDRTNRPKRPVVSIDVNGKRTSYESVMDAVRALGLRSGASNSIHAVLDHKLHYITAYGFKWEWADGEEADLSADLSEGVGEAFADAVYGGNF